MVYHWLYPTRYYDGIVLMIDVWWRYVKKGLECMKCKDKDNEEILTLVDEEGQLMHLFVFCEEEWSKLWWEEDVDIKNWFRWLSDKENLLIVNCCDCIFLVLIFSIIHKGCLLTMIFLRLSCLLLLDDNRKPTYRRLSNDYCLCFEVIFRYI